MGGVAQEVGGACFVESPSVLGFVHCVRLQKFCFSSFCAVFFFSERAFAIATKVFLRQQLLLHNDQCICIVPSLTLIEFPLCRLPSVYINNKETHLYTNVNLILL